MAVKNSDGSLLSEDDVKAEKLFAIYRFLEALNQLLVEIFGF